MFFFFYVGARLVLKMCAIQIRAAIWFGGTQREPRLAPKRYTWKLWFKLWTSVKTEVDLLTTYTAHCPGIVFYCLFFYSDRWSDFLSERSIRPKMHWLLQDSASRWKCILRIPSWHIDTKLGVHICHNAQAKNVKEPAPKLIRKSAILG